MSPTVSAPNPRTVIEVKGPDAEHFLANLLTSNPPQGEQGVWFGLLSPQGKILAEGLMGEQNGSYFLDVAEAVAESFFKRMRMYKLRANLDLILRDDLAATFALAKPEGFEGIVHLDTRGGGTTFRLIGAKDGVSNWNSASKEHDAARVSSGLAILGLDYPADAHFPHDVGMDLNGGVDFKKGCYVGQEVVSRMQHRSTARRRPIIIRGSDHDKICDVLIDDRLIGHAGPAVDGVSVGLLRIDKITDADAATIDGQRVSLAVPEWASYDFSDSSDEE